MQQGLHGILISQFGHLQCFHDLVECFVQIIEFFVSLFEAQFDFRAFILIHYMLDQFIEFDYRPGDSICHADEYVPHDCAETNHENEDEVSKLYDYFFFEIVFGFYEFCL